MVNETSTAASETVTGPRPCTNLCCNNGTVHGEVEGDDRDCPDCLGTTTLQCPCGRGPVVGADLVCVPMAEDLPACARCKADDAAFRRITAPDMAACEAMVALAGGKAGR